MIFFYAQKGGTMRVHLSQARYKMLLLLPIIKLLIYAKLDSSGQGRSCPGEARR